MRRFSHGLTAALGNGAAFFSTTISLFGPKSSKSVAAAPVVDHYKRLGIDASATPKEIKDAYRRLALKVHPDVAAPENRAIAEVEFRKVSESYAVLSDPAQRAQFDATLPKKAKPTPSTAPKASHQQAPASTTTAATKSTKARAQTTRQSTAAPPPPPPPPPPKREKFVRKHADRAFKEAFDGLTLEQVLFNARMAAKRAALDDKKRQDASAAGVKANLESERADNETDGAARHRRAVDRTAAEVADEVAKRLQKRFGPEVLKNIKVTDPRKFYAARNQPLPGSKISFRPFPHMLQQGLPVGVTAPEDPKLGPLVPLSAANEVVDIAQLPTMDVTHGTKSEPEANFALFPEKLRDPATSNDARMRRLSEHAMRDNEGHIYSYQRPY